MQRYSPVSPISLDQQSRYVAVHARDASATGRVEKDWWKLALQGACPTSHGCWRGKLSLYVRMLRSVTKELQSSVPDVTGRAPAKF